MYFFVLQHARVAYEQAGRLDEFTKLGYAHLAKYPDSRGFRFDFADHLLATGAPGEKVLVVLEPVPESWLPSRKIGIRIRALVREAGNEPTQAQRSRLLEEAGRMPGGIEMMIQRFCGLPEGMEMAAMIAESSKQASHANEALGCAVLTDRPQFVERLVTAGADIDAPVSIMQETPLGSALFMGNAVMFETLLRHGADPLRATRDGRTLAELLEDRPGEAADKMRTALAAAGKRTAP